MSNAGANDKALRIPNTSALQRIQARLVPEGDCLVYTGTRNEHGYGCISVGGKNRKAHRVLYEETHGPIPPGLVVMHSCDNPPCCNLDHLSLGTIADNVADSRAKGRGRAASDINRQKTSCKWGHPFTPENTVWFGPDGRYRYCRECKRRSKKESRARAAA